MKKKTFTQNDLKKKYSLGVCLLKIIQNRVFAYNVLVECNIWYMLLLCT